MTPGKFLRAVWPAEGLYCIAWPFKLPNVEPPRTVMAHKVFETIEEAVTYVLTHRNSTDMYFNVLSLREPFIINPNKIDQRTGQPGKREVRAQSNILSGKAFIFDIDVAPDNPAKYPTQGAAIIALRAFVADTGLPVPTIVSSGGGLHVYWIVESSLPASEWQVHEGRLKQLAKARGLLVDPSRTTDTASLLRVAGTFNYKNRSNPLPVTTIKEGAFTPTADFIQLVSDALIRTGQPVRDPLPGPSMPGTLGSNTTREYDGPPVNLKDVGDACAQVRALLKTRGNVDQSAWYHGILNVVKYTEMNGQTGRQLAHVFSQGHPEYSVAETDAKLDQLEINVNAPARCETIAQHSPLGTAGCDGCPFKNDASVPNPLVAARRTAKAAAPIVQPLEGISTVVEIPDAPPPFVRLKAGGIARAGKNKDGDETVEVIYPYDIFPIRRLVNAQNGTEQHLWCVVLPREGHKEFLLDADALYDPRKFVVSITHQGIYPHKSHVASLQEYMVAYISELQRLMDAEAQANHLGWTKEHTEFILPDKIVTRDGVRPVTLSLGAQRSSAQIRKKGDLQTQIALSQFYNRQEYAAHQFFALSALAATLFHATGHHGVIVNASGDAGASKSTALYTGAADFGHPDLYPINGTNQGATVKGRNERISTLANLPICVDEVTHIPVKEMQDLAMSVTQPGHRLRLGMDGVEKAALESERSTIMMCTSNSSLHTLLSSDNVAGTAGSMRVVEMFFRNPGVHAKSQADEYMRLLKEHYGHIGEVFIAQYLKQKEAFDNRVRQLMRQIDEAARIQSSERYWSAYGAVVLAACELARAAGLKPYDPAFLTTWFTAVQIPQMRATVTDEYLSPLAILTNYMEEISGNTIVTEDSTTLGRNITTALNRPHGALLAHYDRGHNLLYFLKKGFKDYCLRHGANPSRIVGELSVATATEAPVIAATNARRTLGAGTDWAKGQSYCYIINMAHPAISGAVDLQAIGTDGKIVTAKLKVAK